MTYIFCVKTFKIEVQALFFINEEAISPILKSYTKLREIG